MFFKKRRQRRKIRKQQRKLDKKSYWLVTVSGYSSLMNPPFTTLSISLAIGEKETPIDWFLLRPKVYSRFEFTPDTLIGFWPMTLKQYQSMDNSYTSTPSPKKNKGES